MFAHGTVHFMLLWHNYFLLYYYIQHHHYHHFYLIYVYCFILYCMYVIVRIITYINVQWWQHASGISHNALMSPRDIYSHKSYHKLFCIHVFCEINISYSYCYSYSNIEIMVFLYNIVVVLYLFYIYQCIKKTQWKL